MCKTLAQAQPGPTPTSGFLLISFPRWKSFPAPGSALRERLPNRFSQRFVNLGIFFFPKKIFQKEVLNCSICPSLLFLPCNCCMGLELPEGWDFIQRRKKAEIAFHYLQLILFITYEGATGSQADIRANMFKGAAII